MTDNCCHRSQNPLSDHFGQGVFVCLSADRQQASVMARSQIVHFNLSYWRASIFCHFPLSIQHGWLSCQYLDTPLEWRQKFLYVPLLCLLLWLVS